MTCVMLVRALFFVSFLRVIDYIFDLVCGVADGLLRVVTIGIMVIFFLYASWLLGSLVVEVMRW